MSETLRNDEHRERAHEDPFSVPVKRTSFGHIDYAHYLSQGRRLRSSAWTRAAVTVCGAFRTMVRWAASRPVRTPPGTAHAAVAGSRTRVRQLRRAAG